MSRVDLIAACLNHAIRNAVAIIIPIVALLIGDRIRHAWSPRTILQAFADAYAAGQTSAGAKRHISLSRVRAPNASTLDAVIKDTVAIIIETVAHLRTGLGRRAIDPRPILTGLKTSTADRLTPTFELFVRPIVAIVVKTVTRF